MCVLRAAFARVRVIAGCSGPHGKGRALGRSGLPCRRRLAVQAKGRCAAQSSHRACLGGIPAGGCVAWVLMASVAPRPVPVERSAAQGSQANSLAVSGVPRPALIDQARDAYQPLLAAAGKNVFDVLSSFPFEDEPAQADLDARPDSDEEGAVLGEISPLAESAMRSVVALFRILPGTAVSFEARGLNQ